MKRVVSVAAVVVAVAVVAFVGASRKRAATRPPATEVLPYQAWAGELGAADQQRYAQVRDQLRLAEKARASTGDWPAKFIEDPSLEWTLRKGELYVNYLGVPADPVRPRWLVLIIEPPREGIRDPAPPEDDEHHTLSDGTGLHVSIWTAPNQGEVPRVVLPFPAAEGWTQRLNGP